MIQELYRQQHDMYTKRFHRIEDRIVNIHQLHIRLIVRGKAKASVGFGVKIVISLVNGYALMEKWHWGNYRKRDTADSVDTYCKRF